MVSFRSFITFLSKIRVNIVVWVRFTQSSSLFCFSFSYFFALLEPFHWKWRDISLQELRLSKTFASTTSSTLSSLYSIFHYWKIDSFDMFYVIWFDFTSHESCYLFIVSWNIEVFLKSFKKKKIFFIFPRNGATSCSILSEFYKFRFLKHCLVVSFYLIFFFFWIEPSFRFLMFGSVFEFFSDKMKFRNP